MLSNTFNNKKTNEFLEHLMNLSYNQKCADCGKKQPSWATLTYSFFICYECSGQHRNLGVLKSKVKSAQMDFWSVDDLRRMYVGGNKNTHKIPESSDFGLKYKDCDEFVQEIDGLVKKSEQNEPGDSFMDLKRQSKSSSFGRTAIKKKQKPRFSDIIEDTTTTEDVILGDNGASEKISKKEQPVFTSVEEDKPEEEHASLQRVSKPTNSLKKSLNAARSPFSFTPKEIDDQDE